jgi:hypothetical protein
VTQPGLFETIVVIDAPKRSRESAQQRKARLAYAATAATWKRDAHKVFVEEFLPEHADFIFEDFTKFYEPYAKAHGLARTVNPKAFAGLAARLRSEGLIAAVIGLTRKRTQGSPSQVYRRV